MAKKEAMIVIKKITIAGGGGHGGSWKVALADFMTAMMAFFLVMWLLGQTEETKKAVSDYFSTPSILEYNYSNFGAELTLEKLFLDLVNEPMKAFEQFMEPADVTPNLLDSGSTKLVAAYMADRLTDIAKNVNISSDGLEFDIPDNMLFETGTAKASDQFIAVMDKVKLVTEGLADAQLSITTMMFAQSVPTQKVKDAEMLAQERSDIIAKKVQAGFEQNTNSISTTFNVKEKKGEVDPSQLIGLIRISIKQKAIKSDGSKPRKLETVFGQPNANMDVYNNFVKQISTRKKDEAQKDKDMIRK